MVTKSNILQAHAPCQPPEGYVFLCIGQDLFSVQNYVSEMWNYSLHEYMETKNQSLHDNETLSTTTTSSSAIEVPSLSSVFPAAFMVYTDIQSLRGLDEPTDYGSGIEYADGLLSLEDSIVAAANDNHLRKHHRHWNTKVRKSHGLTQGLQVGLWLGGSTGCQDIVKGALEPNLQRLYQYIETCPYRVLWIRVGYEFDNPEFGYASDPQAFQDAFQTVVQGCRAYSKICRAKAQFVWHSWAAGLPVIARNNQTITTTTLDDFYPGDDLVDWIGVSVFQQFYQDSALGNRATLQHVLDFASDHEKPVMIAESTPFRGFDVLHDPWNDYFEPVLELIETNTPLIQMWSYINCDWESQPMWRGVGFGETRLAQNRTVLKLWNDHVMKSPLFLQAKDGDLCSQKTQSWRSHDHSHHRHPSSSSLLAAVALLPSRDLHGAGHGSGHFLSHYWYVFLLALLLVWACRFCVSSDQAIYGRYQRVAGGNEDNENEQEALVEENRTGYGTLKQ